jgi:hypothetical protein
VPTDAVSAIVVSTVMISGNVTGVEDALFLIIMSSGRAMIIPLFA